MTLLEMRTTGVKETASALDQLAAQVQDMEDPLTKVAEKLHAHLEAAFNTEGAAGGSGRWVPLTRRYGQWKHRHGPGVPILVGLRPTHPGSRESPSRPESYVPSGKMRRQILAPLQDGLTWQIGRSRMRYVAQSGIAPFHQEGTRKMKPRPPVDPPRVFLSEVDDAFGDWLNRLIGEQGF